MLETRRGFVLGAGALMASSAVAAQPPPPRKVARVDGRPVRVIDIHGHCGFKEVEALVAGTPLAQTVAANLILGPGRIAEMDRRGIDLQVLTVNTWWYAADQALADRIVRLHDEKLAGAMATYAGRFTALSSPALQFPELAARQVERAVKEFGSKGAAIAGHVNGEPPTSAKYDPFWAKCQDLDVPVFMHPNGAQNLIKPGVWGPRGVLDNSIGNPLETTFFLTRMIYDGVFDRFPRLRVCASHGGGYLPSYMSRSEAICTYRQDAACTNRKPSGAYFRDQILVDSMVFSEEALRHLAAEVGAGQIVYGSDLPYPWPDTIDTIARAKAFSAAQKRAMLSGNLERLLKL